MMVNVLFTNPPQPPTAADCGLTANEVQVVVCQVDLSSAQLGALPAIRADVNPLRYETSWCALIQSPKITAEEQIKSGTGSGVTVGCCYFCCCCC